MTWKVWADPYVTTASMESKEIYQPVTFDKNYLLRAARTWLIYYNAPVYTNIFMHIYANRVVSGNNTPSKLLYTSDARSQAELQGDLYGIRETYFEFQDVALRENDTYHFVLNASGYAPAGDSHLAWMKAFPDPILTPPFNPNLLAVNVYPYQIYFVMSKL